MGTPSHTFASGFAEAESKICVRQLQVMHPESVNLALSGLGSTIMQSFSYGYESKPSMRSTTWVTYLPFCRLLSPIQINVIPTGRNRISKSVNLPVEYLRRVLALLKWGAC